MEDVDDSAATSEAERIIATRCEASSALVLSLAAVFIFSTGRLVCMLQGLLGPIN